MQNKKSIFKKIKRRVGAGSIDVAVKCIIAVICGSLVLGGTVHVIKATAMPSVKSNVSGLITNTPSVNPIETVTGGGGTGGGTPAPAEETIPMLNASNADSQGIEYQLNETAHTATVGAALMGPPPSDNIGQSKYTGANGGVVVIPSQVKKGGEVFDVVEIGDFAFYNNTSLVSITVPECVTQFGVVSFQGCTNLTTARVLATTIQTGNPLFMNCVSLENVEMNAMLNDPTNNNYGTFNNCPKLTSFTLKNNITYVPACSFEGCTNVTLNIDNTEGAVTFHPDWNKNATITVNYLR